MATVQNQTPQPDIFQNRDVFLKALTQYIGKLEYAQRPDELIGKLKDYLGDEVDTNFSSELQDIINNIIKTDPYNLIPALKSVYGPNAYFREGQQEAIVSVLQGRKTLVLQRTGWGKSLVYFLSALRLRNKTKFPTIIISPLLALIHNQMETASKQFGLRVNTISSENKADWGSIYDDILADKLDVLFISPERLANQEFKMFIEGFVDLIPLFVVDEAHCISDWGHDFRPDFRRIVKFIRTLSSNTPILATTATANERVLRDIKHQLGEDLEVTRGNMDRPSIDVDIYDFHNDSEKLNWLKNNINRFNGNGIIYCLTIRDCYTVSNFLQRHKIGSVEVYHGELTAKEKSGIEERFQQNNIKFLVCTVAFGMGIDKPDIAFVIHYQQPASIIAYYQQIGRAGRGKEQAKAVMLSCVADNRINTYFINHAFPSMKLMQKIIDIVVSYPNGIGFNKLVSGVNRDSEPGKYWNNESIQKALKYLDVNGDIYSVNGFYYKTKKLWSNKDSRAEIVTFYKWKELKQFNEFVKTKDCYMKFLRSELGDTNVIDCGHCGNCRRKGIKIPKPVTVVNKPKLVSSYGNLFKSKCTVGRMVAHTKFGSGSIIKADGKYIHVKFDNGKESEFNYNMAESFLTLL